MKLEDFYNKKFIVIYIIIFILLYIFCTFISFLGRLPILLIITFFITYYMTKKPV
jgi:hypothetical protein